MKHHKVRLGNIQDAIILPEDSFRKIQGILKNQRIDQELSVKAVLIDSKPFKREIERVYTSESGVTKGRFRDYKNPNKYTHAILHKINNLPVWVPNLTEAR